MKQYLYDLILSCDDGYKAKIGLLVSRKEDLTYLERILAFGLDINEKAHLEPEPYDKVDDIRAAFDRKDVI